MKRQPTSTFVFGKFLAVGVFCLEVISPISIHTDTRVQLPELEFAEYDTAFEIPDKVNDRIKVTPNILLTLQYIR